MKRQWMITAVVGGVAAMALAIAPFVAQAQNVADPVGLGSRVQLLEQIDLTDAQEAQLQEIRRTTREQIANLFTEEQRQAFREGLEAGETFPMVVRSLNLTEEQHTQLRTIVQTSMEQRRNVLTEEQRAQLRDALGRGPRHGGGFHGGGMRGQGPGMF